MSFAFRPLTAAPLAAWRVRFAARRARVDAAWIAMAPRERRMVALCVAAVLAALCWLLLIEPALARVERARAELARQRNLSIELETLLSRAPRDAKAGGATPVTAEQLRASLAQAGLDAVEIAAGQGGAWRLAMHGTRAEPLLQWLYLQPARLRLRPGRIEVLREGQVPDATTRPATPVLEIPGKHAPAPGGSAPLDQYRVSIELTPVTQNER